MGSVLADATRAVGKDVKDALSEQNIEWSPMDAEELEKEFLAAQVGLTWKAYASYEIILVETTNAVVQQALTPPLRYSRE